ncbi:MAG: M48 family metallopeptidase [Muribaculaceae bacterium]|nr:M48 family metallopeptidase [Muribaculaceae bacterium]
MVGYFDDEQLGRVVVYTRRGQRRAIVRWDGDHLKMTVPADLTLSEIKRILNDMRDGIARLKRRTVTFSIGQVLPCFGCEVSIGMWPEHTTRFHYRVVDSTHAEVLVPSGIDMDRESVKTTISACLQSLMDHLAVVHLLPYAVNVAHSLGLDLPLSRLSVGRGVRKLGHCTREGGNIQLSRNVMFLPEHLVRYVICHELAHLQHHDHSPAFHALVDRYTGGQEAQLEAQLKCFEWPITQ